MRNEIRTKTLAVLAETPDEWLTLHYIFLVDSTIRAACISLADEQGRSLRRGYLRRGIKDSFSGMDQDQRGDSR